MSEEEASFQSVVPVSTRRNFLGWAGVTVAALAGMPGCGDGTDGAATQPDTNAGKAAAQTDLLTKDEASLLQAVARVIIPKDDAPGAESVDVLGEFAHRVELSPDVLELFRAGAEHLSAILADLYPSASGYLSLSQEQKEYVMSAFLDKDDGTILHKTHDPEGLLYYFFLMIFDVTRSAFYNSEVAYRMLGYTPPIDGYPRYAEKPGGS